MWRIEPDRISSALLCDVYAIALLFWRKSDHLRQHACPDVAFAWNQAVSALREDFMAPSMATIHAALLDLSGRPVVQIMGNIVTAGQMVTLSHSLGLHRDPTPWKATEAEKGSRIRLWWGVVIHDYW